MGRESSRASRPISDDRLTVPRRDAGRRSFDAMRSKPGPVARGIRLGRSRISVLPIPPNRISPDGVALHGLAQLLSHQKENGGASRYGRAQPVPTNCGVAPAMGATWLLTVTRSAEPTRTTAAVWVR